MTATYAELRAGVWFAVVRAGDPGEPVRVGDEVHLVDRDSGAVVGRGVAVSSCFTLTHRRIDVLKGVEYDLVIADDDGCWPARRAAGRAGLEDAA